MNGDGPYSRSFQSNTMVPNKSTMVEDSDDMGAEDDEDARSDAFALDAVLSRRGTTTTLGDSERKLLIESQSQVSELQVQVEKLEEMLRSKDEELARSSGADQSGVRISFDHFSMRIEFRLTRNRLAPLSAESGMISGRSWRARFPRPRT